MQVVVHADAVDLLEHASPQAIRLRGSDGPRHHDGDERAEHEVRAWS